ncbi:hypothetical protein [Arthrospira platensis]|uniref:hypothetical protein n=1 Tax=Limnospira TaxID=2596745 RepID=UPI0001C394CE|nr:hypothetical protein [Arthrospira platensis]AMW26795.1 hypothetical protein AP285_01075 [Arthrospira platensis YZ]KDR58246.1 hypothetical protein APPUASWS_006360 [Arthrospira platensis str. Paraca]MBD2669547.1 hypothetical protein [Arthrospira platensis FACHB-439]MBD2711051.1 hypothetical protein [Arthrospira platensis FACHB-835]MDT9184439.1 hypothetical protein [Limnospira sp. PMC 289.06]MDT9311958.1 hypothetical protein [Limnospira sp. Paracas R14]QQW29548.1 hypothetical protein AP9108_
MQITINLPPDLEQDLIHQATQSNIPLPTLILQVLRRTMQTAPIPVSQWSEAILSYQGIPDFPAFESYRDELVPPREPEIF